VLELKKLKGNSFGDPSGIGRWLPISTWIKWKLEIKCFYVSTRRFCFEGTRA